MALSFHFIMEGWVKYTFKTSRGLVLNYNDGINNNINKNNVNLNNIIVVASSSIRKTFIDHDYDLTL